MSDSSIIRGIEEILSTLDHIYPHIHYYYYFPFDFCRYYEIGFNTLEEHTLVLCGELCIDRTKFV